jgi:hypothetical protein
MTVKPSASSSSSALVAMASTSGTMKSGFSSRMIRRSCTASVIGST